MNDRGTTHGDNSDECLTDKINDSRSCIKRQVGDMFELQCHGIMVDTDKRRQWSEQLETYLLIHGPLPMYGLMYSRSLLAVLLLQIVADDNNGIPVVDGYLEEMGFEEWERLSNRFETVRSTLLRRDATLFLCPSMESHYDDTECELPEEDDTVNEHLQVMPLFSVEYEEVLLQIRIQQGLSLLRGHSNYTQRFDKAEEYIRFVDGHLKQNSDLHQDFMSVFNERKRTRSSVGTSHKQMVHVLSRNQVHNLIHNHEDASFNTFKNTATGLLLKWENAVFDKPKLVDIGYCTFHQNHHQHQHQQQQQHHADNNTQPPVYTNVESSSDSSCDQQPIVIKSNPNIMEPEVIELTNTNIDIETQSQDLLQHDYSNNNNINDQPVFSTQPTAPQTYTTTQALAMASNTLSQRSSDPLPESLKIAASSEQPSQRYKRKRPRRSSSPRNAHNSLPLRITKILTIPFEDSDVENDYANENNHAASLAAVQLRDLPAEVVCTNHATRKYEHISQSSGVSIASNVTTSRKARDPWTEEETNALKNGIAIIGVGYWKEIKVKYEHQLARRTTVQIKDRFRTLWKKGLLD